MQDRTSRCSEIKNFGTYGRVPRATRTSDELERIGWKYLAIAAETGNEGCQSTGKSLRTILRTTSIERKRHTLVNAGFATPESWRECILTRGSTRFDALDPHRVVDRSRGEIRYDMRIPLNLSSVSFIYFRYIYTFSSHACTAL